MSVEDLKSRVDQLQVRYDAQCAVKRLLQQELEDAKQELHRALLNSISDESKVRYEEKLADMREYIRVRRTKGRARWDSVRWTIRMRADPYRNDFGVIIPDPLDLAVAEFDLLDMGSNFDVRIDVHQESVKRFVEEWMRERMEGALYDADLFAFK
jgi:hypothetical protein